LLKGYFYPNIAAMDQLIEEVEAFCAVAGWTPQRVLRAAIGASWGQWEKWKAGTSSPTLIVADRLRAWMEAHRPAGASEDAA